MHGEKGATHGKAQSMPFISFCHHLPLCLIQPWRKISGLAGDTRFCYLSGCSERRRGNAPFGQKYSRSVEKSRDQYRGGVTLILLGVVGLFLPVLQGILLIIGGLGLLSISNSGLRKWIADLEKRYHSQGLGFKKIKMKTLPRRKLSHNYRNGRLEKGTNYDR